MKTCSKCRIAKPLEEFHRNKTTLDGFAYWCKKCILPVHTKYRTNPIFLAVKYNTSPERLQQLYLEQKGKCAICGVSKSEFGTRAGLYIDHDHSTEQVRGLLCFNCNFMLGQAKDDTNILSLAIDYLNAYKKRKVGF